MLNPVSKKIEFKEEVKKLEEEFEIPELPFGRRVEIHIDETWGDNHYVGLSGIEFYNNEGDEIKISEIKANPPDINILPGYGDDPRTVDKLIDGTYFTQDDMHVWLAPFTKGQEHIIYIDMGKPLTISMI